MTSGPRQHLNRHHFQRSQVMSLLLTSALIGLAGWCGVESLTPAVASDFTLELTSPKIAFLGYFQPNEYLVTSRADLPPQL